MDTKHQKQLILTGLKLIHLVLSVLSFYLFWLLFRYKTLFIQLDKGFRYNYLVLLGYGALLLFFNRSYNAYLLGYSRIRTTAFSQFLSQLFSLIIIYFAVSFGWDHFVNPLIFICLLIFQAALDCAWSYYANLVFFRLNPPRRTIMIYRNNLDKKRFGSIKGKPSERLYHIVEEFRYEGNNFQEIQHKLEGYEAVFVAGVRSYCRNGILKYCKNNNVPGFFLPHIGDVIMQEAKHIQAFDAPVLFVERTSLSIEYAVTKRLFDIISSFVGIVILSPVLLLTAIAIKAYDGGPAIYKQIRLTKDGKEFEIYKFRSMRVDAEKDGVARLSTGDNDDRITPIGRFVRKCRLDELPQLFNILKGDMSVVGPRPERPEIAEQYYQVMPDFKLRLQVKAGLTGYAQIYGKYNTDPYEKLEFDLMYINNMNVLTDLQLIFATVVILFMPDSTEGIATGTATALNTEDTVEQPVDYDMTQAININDISRSDIDS